MDKLAFVFKLTIRSMYLCIGDLSSPEVARKKNLLRFLAKSLNLMARPKDSRAHISRGTPRQTAPCQTLGSVPAIACTLLTQLNPFMCF